MSAYRKERIDNAIGFFTQEHFERTRKHLTQTSLWKYLAFFEREMIQKTGIPPLELEYSAWQFGPVPYKLRETFLNNTYKSELIDYNVSKGETTEIIIKPGKTDYNLDFFSDIEIEEMFRLIEIFAASSIHAKTMSEASHQEMLSWQKAWNKKGTKNSHPIDFAEEFTGDIRNKPEEKLTLQEEMFLAYEAIK